MREIDFEPAERALVWVREGRVRDAVAVLSSLGSTGALVEDALIGDDPSVVARVITLLEDADAAIASRAAYLLGERAWRRKTAEGLDDALVAALRFALREDTRRIAAPLAALRECTRVGGARQARSDFGEVVRRYARAELGQLDLLFAVEALCELGATPAEIESLAGPMDAELRSLLTEITTGRDRSER